MLKISSVLILVCCSFLDLSDADDGPARIIGGNPAAPNSYPAYGVYKQGFGTCGGVLIGPDLFLSAAHCNNRPGIELCFGASQRDCSDALAEAVIISVAVPPGYEPVQYNGLDNDIAVVRLDREITNITPYTWNRDSTIPADGEPVVTIGFGLTDGFEPSSVLRETTLDVINSQVCETAYDFAPVDVHPPDLTFQKICAARDETDSCSGDSGGPLFYNGVVVGIVSGGNGCADPDFPGYYSRTSFHAQFIDDALAGLELPPTPAPTFLPATNDRCVDAIPLTDQAFGATGGTTLDPDLPDAVCGGVSGIEAGVWYVVEGSGDFLEVTTCGDGTRVDTQLAVFGGSCENLQCIDGNDDDFDCPATLTSTVTWLSEVGESYYVHISGFDGGEGEIEVTLSSVTLPPTPAPAPVPEISLCENAQTLLISQIGSTVGAGTAPSIGNNGCGNSVFPGVWYSFVGTGEIVSVDTCGSDTEIDTVLTVYSGSCDSLECVEANDDSCGFSSEVNFRSEDGVTYFVYVAGFDGSEGNFELTFSSVPLPFNAQCVDAPQLRPSQVGTTVGSTVEPSIARTICGMDSEEFIVLVTDSGGVWYQVQGVGATYTVATCGSLTDFDTQISVFTGSCDALECIGGNDQFCDNQSSFSWMAEDGFDYFIYIHGFNNEDVGNFELSFTVSDASPDKQSSCETAAVLRESQKGQLFGFLADEDSATLLMCGTSVEDMQVFTDNKGGVWYEVLGLGDFYSVSTCNGGTDMEIQIAVFMGSCGSLKCIGGTNQSCSGSVSWQSEIGETYYVYVHSVEPLSGSFELTFSGYPALNKPRDIPLSRCEGDCTSNDDCEGDLICFERGVSNPVSVVPGCSGTPGSLFMDFCVMPEAIRDDTLVYLGENGSPPSAFPLKRCQGSCRNDLDCDGVLQCMQREYGGEDPVPGCDGILATDDTNYCF